MATYFAVPLKRTWEVDFDKPLNTFIANTFADAKPEEYRSSITEFTKLRNNMITKSQDKHDSALEVLYRYYDQLVTIEGKLPIAENSIRINFKWQDAFDKESFFSGKRTLTIASASYEMMCVLFNIAALQSQVAECQNHSGDEGLKMSAKLFQQSSGVFSYMKDSVLSYVQSDPTPDLHPDTLAALSSLMLAQAQDCFVRKAMQDRMKPVIVAKLAHQCSDFYADALKLVQLDSIRSLWPKDWISTIASKQAAFHALAEYYHSLVHKEAKEFGEEIARLKHAKHLMGTAENKGGPLFSFQTQYKLIYKGLEDAVKDNDFIYHAKVPDVNSLSSIGKAAVAKPLPLGSPMSKDFKDLFEKVVPLAVHQALVGFENRKAEVVNMQVGRLREATQLMNSVLSSLNLPAAIEDLSGKQVPASVLEKAQKMREMGGIAYLGRLMTDLPELLQRNKEILDECDRQMNEEQQSDTQLRDQFKDRWTRTPSEKLTQPIRSEAAKYRTIINNAISADAVVQQRFAQHREGIEILSKPDSEIDKALPSGSAMAGMQGSPVVATLRQLMEQVNTIKAEREVMESQLKDSNCDVAVKFMNALAQDGAINEESLSVSEIDRVYGPLRDQVAESCHRQESILAQVQQANTEFCNAKSSRGGASREEKLKDLAAAYDNFIELKNNLEEGTKFYNDLTQLLVKFQTKSSDFCFARKTEKDELIKDLQNSIVRQQAAPAPAAPAYQQPTEAPSSGQQSQQQGGSRVPPARPPPPSRVPQPQAPPVAPQAAAPQAAAPRGAAPGYGQYPQQTPYPVYPPGGYCPPPMPQAYNPYMSYGGYPQQGQPPAQAPYPNQQPQYPVNPQQQYPGYPPYPQQPQWR